MTWPNYEKKFRTRADDLAGIQSKNSEAEHECPASEAFISFSGLFISELLLIGFFSNLFSSDLFLIGSFLI